MTRLQHNGAHCQDWWPLTERRTARVLLVGEDNPHSEDPRRALHFHPPGAAGDRLRRILGLDKATYLSLWRVNLCVGRWSTLRARDRAGDLLLDVTAPWSVVVMLGAKVASACGYPHGLMTCAHATVRVEEVEYGEAGWVRQAADGEFMAVSLPHPSGRCRVWNDASSAERARMTMRAVAPELPWGSSS